MQTLTTLLTLALGICFVLLGRWLYLNPRKFFRGWGFLNPEHPGVQKLFRFYATFFIFFGLLISVGFAFMLLGHGFAGSSLLALAIAIVGAWFLRPTNSQPGPDTPRTEAPAAAVDGQTASPSLLTRHWKRTVAIGVGSFAAFIGILAITLANSDVSKMAFAAAEASPVVKQRLGTPIKRGFFVSGTLELYGPSRHADLVIPVSGPSGKATIYAVAKKTAGVWKFDALEVELDEANPRLSLLNKESSFLKQ
jgi:hypothetical protein